MSELNKFNEVSRIIPWATQTNAKRPRERTYETTPFFTDRAHGARIVNTLGQEYLDFLCALGPIILGHTYKKVDDAVKKEIDKGFLFSLASPLEHKLAKRILEIFPYYDWVRFLKTGNDVTTAAVRLARAYTGKNKILQYGYHGWNDWAQTRFGFGKQKGIPSGVLAYTIPFDYNDITFIETILKNDDDIAGIILTPYDMKNEPENNFLGRLRELCTHYDIPLMFDEVLSGFRIGFRGAQGEFGVEPDICCFGKAIANGYPLAVITGRKKYADALAESKTIITTTYAGETLSIAAALATLDEMEEKDIFSHINKVGGALRDGLNDIINRHGYPLMVTGRPGLLRMFVCTGDDENDLMTTQILSKLYLAKKIYVREMDGLGFYLTYSHTIEDIEHVIELSGEIFASVFQ